MGEVEVKPVRMRLSRSKGFNLQEASQALNGLPVVNVCRPTIYGNPFVHADAAVAVEAYERHCRGGTQSFEMGPGKLQFAGRVHRNSLHWAFPDWLREHGLPAIAGKNLACACDLDAPCHADVLLRLANPIRCEAAPTDAQDIAGAA